SGFVSHRDLSPDASADGDAPTGTCESIVPFSGLIAPTASAVMAESRDVAPPEARSTTTATATAAPPRAPPGSLTPRAPTRAGAVRPSAARARGARLERRIRVEDRKLEPLESRTRLQSELL